MTIPAAKPKNTRGFTLIEMSMVVGLVLLLASLIVPNVVALQRSRRLKDTEGAIARLPLEALNEAKRGRKPVTIQVQENALVLSRVPDANSVEEVKRVALGSEIQVATAQRSGENTDTASWQWRVYPDGTADSGGLEFRIGNLTKSLRLAKDGSSQWLEGNLPDSSQDSWQAGELEQK